MLYAPPCLQRNLGILGSQSHSQEWSHRFSAPGFPGQSLPHPADGASRSRLWLTPNPPQSHVLKGWPGPLGTARGLGTKRFVASLRAAHLTSEDVTVPRPHPRPSDPYSGGPRGEQGLRSCPDQRGSAQTEARRTPLPGSSLITTRWLGGHATPDDGPGGPERPCTTSSEHASFFRAGGFPWKKAAPAPPGPDREDGLPSSLELH